MKTETTPTFADAVKAMPIDSPSQINVSKDDAGTVTFLLIDTKGREIAGTLSRGQALVLGAELVSASAESVICSAQDAQRALTIRRYDLAATALSRIG